MSHPALALGYGRTTGWDDAYDGDLGSFGLLNQRLLQFLQQQS
jgi:hypothetical protein